MNNDDTSKHDHGAELPRLRSLGGLFALVAALASPATFATSGSNISLADSPLLTQTSVPGNLLLELSVEYPTALSLSNHGSFNPQSTTNPNGTVYIGYFDPNLCYDYIYDSTISTSTSATINYYAENYVDPVTGGIDSTDYFRAAAVAGDGATCSGKWSGAFLNWAGMQSVDPFRWALTGGYRSLDTATTTILKKAWANGSGGSGETPNRTLSGNVSSYTPFTWANLSVRIWGIGTRMQFTGTGGFNNTNGDTSDTPYTGGTLGSTDTVQAVIYSAKVRVKACDNSFNSSYLLGPNGVTWCTPYGANYKPEGLIQTYSRPNSTGAPPSIRFGALGYLNDSSILRDAGVLRAQMAFLGPIAPTSTDPIAANPNPEWSGTTGVYNQNPDPVDLASTNAAYQCATSNGTSVPCAAYSGVINYLNDFGEITHTYKTYDPVSELYYAGIRYYKHLGNVPEWSNITTSTTAQKEAALGLIDQFPVITDWITNNPIIYACQKNYILGIGDVNTHASGNIPGGGPGVQPQYNSGNEPAMPSAVTADMTTNPGNLGGVSGIYAVSATNYVGKIEGIGNIGNEDVPWCCSDNATYLMAGLAYDSHVNDMQPSSFTTPDNLNSDGSKLQIQTATTYWLDVEENGVYHYENQFWLAAKYGGFVLPAGSGGAYTYAPYQATSFPQSAWSHTTDSQQPGGAGRAMPDNYYGAGNAQALVSGLNSAFSSIAASNSTTTTGLASSNYNPVGSSFGSYATTYDPATWSSDITAYLTSFDGNGDPINTKLWDTRPIVDAQFAVSGTTNGWDTNRFIATYNPTVAAGVPFRVSATAGAGISTTQQTALKTVPNTAASAGLTSAVPYLDYLRGDQTNEAPAGIGFRARAYLQGDIVDSQLVPVGAPSAAYTSSNDPGYPAFVTAHSTRNVVLYAGANDGMMHAYDGSELGVPSGGTGGTELFSYVPNATFAGPDGVATNDGLAALGNPSFVHHFYVDQTPVVGDVDLVNTNHNQVTQAAPTSQNWISLLVGGLGKGGRAYYALDITNPQNLSNEANLASAVKWEFTNSLMGFSYGVPLIVKTKKYGWTVVLTSGMNTNYSNDTSNGQGYFFIVNPANGQLLEPAISTGQGTPSAPAGLAYATGLILLADGSTDAIYAGDLLGNVWRLNVTGTSGYYPAPTLLAQLFDANNTPQPVTSQPAIVIDPATNNRIVTVGTGSLIGPADLTDSTNFQQQTFYALLDGTATQFATYSGPITRTSTANGLASIDGPAASPTVSACSVSTNVTGVTLASTQRGFYLDLGPTGSTTPTCRVNIAPLPGPGGSITVAANLPSAIDYCQPTGTNEVFSFYVGNGSSLIINSSGNYSNLGQTVPGGLIQNLSIYSVTTSPIGSGTTTGSGSGGTSINATTATSTGKLNVALPPDLKINRLNWREVPSDD